VRHRVKPANKILDSLIDPIDRLSETIFSILILLIYLLAFSLSTQLSTSPQSISDEDVNNMLIGVLGAVVAWGLIDGIMYALLSMLERGEINRLLKDIQAARSEQEAVDFIEEDLDYILEPIAGETDRKTLYLSIYNYLRNGKPRAIGLQSADFYAVLGHVIVAVIAVFPSIIPFLVLGHDFVLAVRISFLVSFVVLFITGYRWGLATGANPWKIGLLLVSIAFALVLIAILLGG
jgi:hypothetical protein